MGKRLDMLNAVIGSEGVVRESSIGCKFYVWEITYRKAINALLKKGGFTQSGNANYIHNLKAGIDNPYTAADYMAIRKNCTNHKNIFLIEAYNNGELI